MVLKFHVKLVPENTTFSDYKLNEVDGKGLYTVSKGDDGTIYVQDLKIIGNRKNSKTVVKFSVEDLQKHGIKTDVTLNVYKDPS